MGLEVSWRFVCSLLCCAVLCSAGSVHSSVKLQLLGQQSGRSERGRNEALALFPHHESHWWRALSGWSLQGLVGKRPGLCVPFGLVYFCSVGLPVQKLVTVYVWEHLLALPFRGICRMDWVICVWSAWHVFL